MRPILLFAVLLCATILVVSCSTERTTAPQPDPFSNQNPLIREQATAEDVIILHRVVKEGRRGRPVVGVVPTWPRAQLLTD